MANHKPKPQPTAGMAPPAPDPPTPLEEPQPTAGMVTLEVPEGFGGGTASMAYVAKNGRMDVLPCDVLIFTDRYGCKVIP